MLINSFNSIETFNWFFDENASLANTIIFMNFLEILSNIFDVSVF